MSIRVYYAFLCVFGILALCQQLSRTNARKYNSEGVKVFVGILSRSSSAAKRAAIRATWGGHPGLHRVIFILARTTEDDLFEKVCPAMLV